MKLQARQSARLALLAAALIAAPIAAQQTGQAPRGEVPVESLVLVLNLISSTHARRATGVVLAGGAQNETQAGAGTALVLVPADFVHAGDEIIVLDGGNDILRDGRATRTVARSADTGVAVLEVDGLVRSGVTLTSDDWPGPASATYTFAAWPGAEALVEGAAMTRRTISANAPLPELTGPLFDQCGNLAAMHIFDVNAGQTTGGQALAAFLETFEVDFVQAACLNHSPEADQALAPETPDQNASEELAETVKTVAASTVGAELVEPPRDSVTSLGLTPGQKTGLLLAWGALALLALLHYSRRRKRSKADPIVLERRTESGRRFRHLIKLDAVQRTGSFERNGLILTIQETDEGFAVSMPEDDYTDRVGFYLDGTPCLGGEKFMIVKGQEILLGNETLSLMADSEKPGPEEQNS